MDAATKLFLEVKSPIVGFSFTKHFWVRYVERFKLDLRPVDALIKKIDEDLIFLIYEAEQSPRYKQTVLQFNGATIPLVLMHGEYPELKAATIYSKVNKVH